MNIQGFLCTMLNNAKCSVMTVKLFSPLINFVELMNVAKHMIHPVTGLNTAYKPMKGQHVTETEFVKNTAPKTTTIVGILYLDFETFPQPVNEVIPPTPTSTPDDGYAEEESFEHMEVYTPYPFDARQLSTKST